MATNNNANITEKRIESPKFSMLISALATFLSGVAVILSLAFGGYSPVFYIFPTLLVISDAVFIILSLYSNYRFRYSLPIPIGYMLVSITLTVLTVLIDGGANGTSLFTHLAIYSFLALHLFSAVAVALGLMNAAKVGKNPKIIKNISTAASLSLVLLTVLYSYSVFAWGWFGQGTIGVERPLEYLYNEEDDTYSVVGVLSGRGDTVVVPATFNGKAVSALDCKIFESPLITKIYIDAPLKWENLSNAEYLAAEGERTINVYEYENIRASLISAAYTNSSSAMLSAANSVRPTEIEEGKVYVSFSYTLEDLVATRGEALPVWSGNVGDVISEEFFADYDYIAHKYNPADMTNNHWSYANVGGRIYTGVEFGAGAGFGMAVNSSMDNVRVVFEPLIKVTVADDNDTVHPEPTSFKKFNYDGELVDNIFVIDEIDTWFATYESREGFDVEWIADKSSGASGFTTLSEVAEDGMTLYPQWKMKSPTITSITSSGTVTYGDAANFSSVGTAASDDFTLSYVWTYGGAHRADGANFSISSAHPANDTGTYTLALTSGNSAITSLTSTVYKNVDLQVNKKMLNLVWQFPNDSATNTYKAADYEVKWSVNPEEIVGADVIGFQGQTADNAGTVGYKNAGAYQTTALLNSASAELYYVQNPTQNFEITPYEITVDWENLDTLIYSGAAQAPTASKQSPIEDVLVTTTVIGGATINAGTGYTATVASTNSNYTVANPVATFKISPLDVYVTWSNVTTLTYNGRAQAPAVSAVGIGGANVALNVAGGIKNVGTSTAVVTSADTNYNVVADTSRPDNMAFEVVTKELTVTWATSNNPADFVYDGKEHKFTVSASGAVSGEVPVFKYVYSLGEGVYPKNVGDDSTVSAMLDSSAVNANYVIKGGDTLTISVTVSPLPVTLNWNIGASVTYKGANYEPKIANYIAGGKALSGDLLAEIVAATTGYTGDTAVINAGEDYSVSAVIENANFMVSDKSHTFTVKPKSITLTWSATNLTYNGTVQTVSVTSAATLAGSDRLEDVISLSNNTAKNVGMDYVATATSNSNYMITNPTKAYKINHKGISVSWALLSERELTYDGKQFVWVATLSGVVEGDDVMVSVSYSSGTAPTNAGNGYLVTANLGTDAVSANYTISTGATKTFSIAKRSVDLIWQNTTVVYNDAWQRPNVKYIDINDMDIDVTSFVMTNEGAGIYQVEVMSTFTGNENYSLNNPSTTFVIERATAVVQWENLTFKYDNLGIYAPTAYFMVGSVRHTLPLTYSSPQSEAGKYVATVDITLAMAQQTNYTFENTSVEFEITPISVDFSISEESSVYDGEEKDVTISAADGEANDVTSLAWISLIITKDGDTVAEIRDAGTYTITVSHSTNVVTSGTTTFTYVVEKKSVSITWNTDEDIPVATVSGADGKYTLVYKEDGVILDEAPTEDGTYTVEVVLADAENYMVSSGDEVKTFTIGTPVINPF